MSVKILRPDDGEISSVKVTFDPRPTNVPEGLFERIEKEPESICLYRRLYMDYTYGI